MEYFFLILQAVIFSFGGLLIKASGTMVSPMLLSALRFAIGICLLIGIQRMGKGKTSLLLANRWILFGGCMKAVHYLGENYGVMHGFSYGGIIVWPIQTLVVLLASVLFFREKLSGRTAFGTALCLTGIGLVTWNGAGLQVFMQAQASTFAAFVLAGMGAAGFFIAQKQLVKKMDIVELNASMFTYGLAATLVVLPFTRPHLLEPANVPGTASILILGAITCVGFLLQAAAIRKVPMVQATIIQSCTVILSILWGVTFYGDSLSIYVISGTAIFLVGIAVVTIKPKVL
ncbi:MAG: DMT family transporter [Blautia sp.]|nr:DMT family transporter [Blautia sp.]